MEAYSRNPVEYNDNSIEFQALEWVESNEPLINPDDMDIDEDFDEEAEVYNKYTIRSFGV